MTKAGSITDAKRVFECRGITQLVLLFLLYTVFFYGCVLFVAAFFIPHRGWAVAHCRLHLVRFFFFFLREPKATVHQIGPARLFQCPPH